MCVCVCVCVCAHVCVCVCVCVCIRSRFGQRYLLGPLVISENLFFIYFLGNQSTSRSEEVFIFDPDISGDQSSSSSYCLSSKEHIMLLYALQT